jgi:hypothetical protein
MRRLASRCTRSAAALRATASTSEPSVAEDDVDLFAIVDDVAMEAVSSNKPAAASRALVGLYPTVARDRNTLLVPSTSQHGTAITSIPTVPQTAKELAVVGADVLGEYELDGSGSGQSTVALRELVAAALKTGLVARDPELLSGRDYSAASLVIEDRTLPSNSGMSRGDFSGSRFIRVRASRGCDMSRCVFAGTVFEDCTFDGCNFAACAFHLTRFAGRTRFTNCSFRFAAFTGSTFDGKSPSTFQSCDFDLAEIRLTSVSARKQEEERAWTAAVASPRNWRHCVRSSSH